MSARRPVNPEGPRVLMLCNVSHGIIIEFMNQYGGKKDNMAIPGPDILKKQ